MLRFTDAQIHDQAVRLGLITDDQDLPQDLRSQVVASLARAAAGAGEEPDEPEQPAAEVAPPDANAVLTVYADGPVLLNGAPFPLYVAKEPIEVTARPDGLTTVRLTVVVGTCHLLPGAPNASAP